MLSQKQQKILTLEFLDNINNITININQNNITTNNKDTNNQNNT